MPTAVKSTALRSPFLWIGVLLFVALVGALVFSDSVADLARFSADYQQRIQRVLSTALRDVHAGSGSAALWTLVVVCFGYGVVHTLGPGHGKAVVVAYFLDSSRPRAWIEGTVTRTVPSYTDTFAWFKQRLHPPGTHFYYASIEPAIAAWAVREATGQHPSDYLSDRIWKKIGAEHDASWVLDRPGGIEIGSCCINATARDYARFGQLFLDDGRVGREQVLPAGWVRQVRTPNPQRPFLHATQRLRDLPFGYQYNWWLWPEPTQTISAHGVFGQQITIDFDDRVRLDIAYVRHRSLLPSPRRAE